MREVVFELKVDGAWRRLASLAPSQPPASLTSEEPDGHQVLLLGWLDGIPGFWRSQAGLDYEAMERSVRVVASTGFDLIADLRQVGCHEFVVNNARYGIQELRVTLEDG